KSYVLSSGALMSEEPDLEALFRAAVAEVHEQLDDEDFEADYGFQSEWDDEDRDSDEEEAGASDQAVELRATEALFDSMEQFPGNEEKIERFCLPIFSTGHSDHAVVRVLA